ncbi:Holliday junction resolvase RecU [Neobacillus sp. D3-1R]|uniref:Holliday junction resolvase RecU n=1 Tax=Neobacillus sp. D3-1R TaxID=3445778 RepID=UPI003F9F8467
MNFHYPNGKPYIPKTNSIKTNHLKKNGSFSNRGMTLEEDLNLTNEYYRENNIAIIHKKPTPVQIVHVDYPKRSAAVIKEAYFKQASTTDYNGVYKGRYIDFEAKETQLQQSFPLKNFHEHQIKHISSVLQQEGICFVIIRFAASEEIFLLEGEKLLTFWNRMLAGGRKSMTIDEINEHGHLISVGFHPRIDYIKIIDKLYPF